MKKFKMVLNENSGIKALSLVKSPAIESDFVKLAKEDKKIRYKFSSDDQQIVTGAVLIPDQLIFRTAESLGEKEDGYIFFDADTIKQLAYQFMQNAGWIQTDLNHGETTWGVTPIESWVIADSKIDKAATLGLDLPVGTWMLGCKVNDDKLWAEIRAGDYNGFSLDAVMGKMEVAMGKEGEKSLETSILEILEENLNNK